jgi:methionyl-tRNA synthetase
MDKLRQSLNLPKEIMKVDELGVPMAAGHAIGKQLEYFPAVSP